MSKKYEILPLRDGWLESDYRYRLDVSTRLKSPKRLVVIQLNPSMAGQTAHGTSIRSDATVGKVATWASERMFSSISFLNLFAFISTPQSGLASLSYGRLVGPMNDEFLASTVEGATRLVVAWGKPEDSLDRAYYARRIDEVRLVLGRRSAFSIGPLVDGSFPRHGKNWNQPHRDDLRPFRWK